MKLKKLGAALVVVAALSAVLASSALAAAVTEDVKWYTGTSPGTELTGSETVAASQVGTATLATGPVVLHTTGVECVGCKIENSGGTAVGSGQLKFTGITVEKPAGCTVVSSITTKALSWQADWMSGATNYWRFVPTAGSLFFSFEVSGAECTQKGIVFSHLGTLLVQTANGTKTQAVEQNVNSSPTINKEGGGTTHTSTEEVASLTATIAFKLSGAKAGMAFGTHWLRSPHTL